ncbi:MAG: flippase-like domain-containing protein [Alphaproteobacteria bacterium]|nr:flippase-like domain-containing protein [Alphaproteobacteria bacterium]
MTTPGAQVDEAAPRDALERARGAVGAMLAVAVVGYLSYALWKGWRETADHLAGFAWAVYLPVLALTLVNYGLRFAKWAWLLRRLGVDMPLRGNLGAFVAGLGMVISPGKAGELVKPYLVREVTGTPMAVTIPALVTERLTDGIAVVILAAFGVSTFYPDSTALIATTLACIAAGIAALSIEPLAMFLLGLVAKVPVLGRLAPKLEESYRALRTCLGPVPLVVTLAMSLVAWFAECIGYWLVFRGLGVDCSLELATFLYAFATVFGAPSPGGMGMADVALVEGAVNLVPGCTEAQALAAALLVRVATLWFGVVLGAVALLRLDAIVRQAREERQARAATGPVG